MTTQITNTIHNNLPAIHMHHPSGSTLLVYLFGAHIASWTTFDDQEVIFMSKSAVFDGKTPIRGGIPIAFPQFGGGTLPSHGFARRSVWSFHSHSNNTLILSLKDSASTRDMWNDNQFQLLYTITLESNSITTSLNVENTGSKPFNFQALLHTYFHLADISQASVEGLSGQTYLDSLADRTPVVQSENEALTFTQETDRIFRNAPTHVQLNGLALLKKARKEKSSTAAKECVDENKSKQGGSVTIDINIQGGSGNNDVVVWNPWIDKSKRMADLSDEEYHNFCCVEPGYVIDWETLNSGETYTISQTLSVLDTAGETKL